MKIPRALLLVLALVAVESCSRFGPTYPSRPEPSEGPPVADPEPARVVAHLTMTSAALATALDAAAPHEGEGTFPMLGVERHFTWTRGPFTMSFSQGRVALATVVQASAALPLKVALALEIRVDAEPVISADYAVKLQSVDVHVSSRAASVGVVDRVSGLYERIGSPIADQLRGFAYDLRPVLAEASARVEKPAVVALGDAVGCARLQVLEIEAGPTVFADGIEKDVALVVAPSITFPCGAAPDQQAPHHGELAPLANVSSLTSGPFVVTIPIAARYEELAQAMALAFSGGKLFFSKDYPELYLSRPQVYEASGELVLSVHIAGPVHNFGIDSELDGDLYLTGHPAVVDNELAVPDLEPTIETRSFLLSLKAMTDGDRIRDQARQALRIDIGSRLREARAKFGDDLTFASHGGCFYGDVDRVQVVGVHPHQAYLRVYVAVTARARLRMPCLPDAAPDAPVEAAGPQ